MTAVLIKRKQNKAYRKAGMYTHKIPCEDTVKRQPSASGEESICSNKGRKEEKCSQSNRSIVWSCRI